MSGAMLRHMKSLRNMRRDNGWIHTLLEEAENGISSFLQYHGHDEENVKTLYQLDR